MTKFYIMLRKKLLSGFYPNRIFKVFECKGDNFFAFHSLGESKRFIQKIKYEINKPSNMKRYGRYAKQHQFMAENLQILRKDK